MQLILSLLSVLTGCSVFTTAPIPQASLSYPGVGFSSGDGGENFGYVRLKVPQTGASPWFRRDDGIPICVSSITLDNVSTICPGAVKDEDQSIALRAPTFVYGRSSLVFRSAHPEVIVRSWSDVCVARAKEGPYLIIPCSRKEIVTAFGKDYKTTR
jgi:hypothetical protein